MAEKLYARDPLLYRLMEDKNTALHASVCKTLKTAHEQVALSRKTISQSRAVMARLEQTLQDLTKPRF